MLTMAAIGENIHDLSVFEASSDVAGDGTGGFLGFTPDQCQVFAIDRSFKEFFRQGDERPFGTCDDHQTRCILVDAMYQSGPMQLIGEMGRCSK